MHQCVFFLGLCVCVCFFVFCESQLKPAPISHQLSHRKVSQYLGNILRHHSCLWNGAIFSSQWGTDCRSRYHYYCDNRPLGSISCLHSCLLGHQSMCTDCRSTINLLDRIANMIWLNVSERLKNTDNLKAESDIVRGLSASVYKHI